MAPPVRSFWYLFSFGSLILFFVDIILVAHQNLHSRLTQLIKLHINEGGNHISIVPLDNLGSGTMEALRTVRPHLHSDFILLTCDLISEFPLYKMIDQHRTNNALVTLMLASSQGPSEETSRYTDLEDNDVYAGMDESRKKLLYFVGKADIEDTVDFKMSLLSRYHCILLRTNLTDAHCYIFRKEFLEMLDSEEAFGRRSIYSVREELLPRLVKMQTLDYSCKEKIHSYADHKVTGNVAVRLVDREFCFRVNNLKNYTDANRFICKTLPATVPKVSPSAEVNPKGGIGSDSMLGDFSKTGEKTSVKRSVLGANVIVGKNVKISNCIIMDNVVIEDK